MAQKRPKQISRVEVRATIAACIARLQGIGPRMTLEDVQKEIGVVRSQLASVERAAWHGEGEGAVLGE